MGAGGTDKRGGPADIDLYDTVRDVPGKDIALNEHSARADADRAGAAGRWGTDAHRRPAAPKLIRSTISIAPRRSSTSPASAHCARMRLTTSRTLPTSSANF